jgi:hypothetical protein
VDEFKLVDGKLVRESDGVRTEISALSDGGLMIKVYHTGFLVCRRELSLRDMLGGKR